LNLRNDNTHKAMDTWIQRHKATIRGRDLAHHRVGWQ
jgi:hypothetical protein